MASTGLNWPQQAKYGLNSNGLKWPHMAFDKKLSFFQFSNWVQKIKFSAMQVFTKVDFLEENEDF